MRSWDKDLYSLEITSLCKEGKCVTYLLIHLCICGITFVDLMEYDSILNEHDPGSVAGRLCRVGYHKDSLAHLIYLRKKIQKFIRGLGIKSSRRLICQYYPGRCDQGPGNCDLLFPEARRSSPGDPSSPRAFFLPAPGEDRYCPLK